MKRKPGETIESLIVRLSAAIDELEKLELPCYAKADTGKMIDCNTGDICDACKARNILNEI